MNKYSVIISSKAKSQLIHHIAFLAKISKKLLKDL